MELTLGIKVGGDRSHSSQEREGSTSSNISPKKNYQRHTPEQIQHLEAFFKDCPHPTKEQRHRLSSDLGLEIKQVKFWFQNKRTQLKAHSDRHDNSSLRAENESILCENLALREVLQNVVCNTCRNSTPPNEEDQQRDLLKLHEENIRLKEEHERVACFLAQFVGRTQEAVLSSPSNPSLTTINLLNPSSFTPHPTMGLDNGSGLEIHPFMGATDAEKPLIFEAAAAAMKELIKLICNNEPLWLMTSAPPEGRYVMNQNTCKKLFPRPSYFRTPTARVESSKDLGVVPMDAGRLVAMMMKENGMLDLFPTILSKAKIHQVIEEGKPDNQNGRLMLMYQQHIVSPLVTPRDFYVLRYCLMVEAGKWVILDVSYNWLREKMPLTRSWRLPSGCLIQEMPTGLSKVTWVEHVEVDDISGTHCLFRDLVQNGSAYGAERWIITLRRMCERFNNRNAEIEPHNTVKNILQLSQRMINNFCSSLSMSGEIDFGHLNEGKTSGLRLSVRKAVGRGQPDGMIVTAATSLWLPLHREVVSNFFSDLRNRSKWDILTSGHQLKELAHIVTGSHPGNSTSLIRPFLPSDSYMLILQECWADQFGGMIVYAPIDVRAMNVMTATGETEDIPIIPTGFIISGDGGRSRATRGCDLSLSSASSSRASGAAGSLLTVVYQILHSVQTTQEVNMECLATINGLVNSSVQKIKVAFNCSNLE
ncbi:hypothetical protein ACFE04_006547 [Oxalis oulophora]